MNVFTAPSDQIEWHAGVAQWAMSKAHAVTLPQFILRGRMAWSFWVTVLGAVGWIVFRTWQVLQTPNEVLVDKLGLDIPPAPEVTLEEIGETEIQITWKLPDVHSSITQHVIQLNGLRGEQRNRYSTGGCALLIAIVGETKRHETAVSVLQLKPATFYDLRVFTVSAAGFQTPSRVVHFRTLGCPLKPEQDVDTDQYPTIRTNMLRAPPLPSPSATPMARELSGGPVQARRATIGRRQSHAMDIPISQVEEQERLGIGGDGDGSLARLSERFQKIQQDNEAIEAQHADEDREFEASLRDLEARRDELKQSLKERDEASNDLKRQVHKMESANRSAQNEKSKKEKLLQQKEGQRKKRKDDIARWTEQTIGIEEELARIEAEKAAVEEDRQRRVRELKEKMDEEQKEVRKLDESIKEKGSQVKTLEEERKKLHTEDDNEESRETDRLEFERDQQWQKKLVTLQQSYTVLNTALENTRSQFEAARERLAWYETARRNNPAYAPIVPLDLDMAQRLAPLRRGRNRGSLNSNLSSPNVPFSAMDTAFGSIGFSQQPVNPSPTLSSGSAFFNMNNGTALAAITEPGVPTAEEIDILTGGAPMSPRADALLPSNLLGDEESVVDAHADVESSPRSPFVENRGGVGLGPPALPEGMHFPVSPSSSGSSEPSASLFQSPRESLQNVNEYRDHDRSSLRSTQLSPIQASPPSKSHTASSKMAGLFNFNRQRGKTSSEEPPMLGALKPGQSQSFPRNYEDGMEPLGPQHRRRLSQGNWAAGFLPKTFSGEEKDQALHRSASGGRRMLPSIFSSSSRLNPANFGKSTAAGSFDPFRANTDPSDPSVFNPRTDTSSPRPSSVYSFDRLPRPSTEKESQPFGWGPQVRSSPLGPDWAVAWSRNQSRRPSFQYGSTSNLSGNLPHENIEYIDPPREPSRPLQAPIGTRPASSSQPRPVTPKLNPAAPTFRTLFTKKPEKEKEKGKEREFASRDSLQADELSFEDASPPDSRRSKDARSITTANSMASISVGDSGESSLDRIASATGSETTPSNAAKETFIQKITRKSSSTKFNSWKDRSGSLFLSSRGGNKGATSHPSEPPSTPSEFGEHSDNFQQFPGSNSGEFTRSFESGTSLTPSTTHEKDGKESGTATGQKSSRSSINWGFMRKKDKKGSKKGGEAAPSEASEITSVASETGDESWVGSHLDEDEEADDHVR